MLLPKYNVLQIFYLDSMIYICSKQIDKISIYLCHNTLMEKILMNGSIIDFGELNFDKLDVGFIGNTQKEQGIFYPCKSLAICQHFPYQPHGFWWGYRSRYKVYK